MGMLVNRTPVDEDVVQDLRACCEGLAFGIDTIPADEIDETGRDILARLLVEGEPADGITLHGTRWGWRWCAYRTVD